MGPGAGPDTCPGVGPNTGPGGGPSARPVEGPNHPPNKDNKMSRITKLYIAIHLVLILALIWQMRLLVVSIRNAVVYDIDLVRMQFEDETRFLFMQGCLKGTVYNNPNVMPDTSFNPGSATNYCNDLFANWETYVKNMSKKLGREF